MVKNIISNVLVTLYQNFGASLVLAFFVMFFFMFAKENGVKEALKKWINSFTGDKVFRKWFVFVFYTCMLLFKTLLCRSIWTNPVSNVLGSWGFYKIDGTFTTEVVENLVLFIPFTILLLRVLGYKRGFSKIVLFSISTTLCFSLTIEFLQLFLKLGTFQLSDLFYNTLGGFIGGLIYALYRKLKK